MKSGPIAIPAGAEVVVGGHRFRKEPSGWAPFDWTAIFKMDAVLDELYVARARNLEARVYVEELALEKAMLEAAVKQLQARVDACELTGNQPATTETT